MKTDTSNQEQAHKIYGKEAYEHSSRQYEVHLLQMMNYIARKEGVRRLSRFMNKPFHKREQVTKILNYCEPTQNSRSVQLIYDSINKKWKSPRDDDKGRSSSLH